jgi:general secretion pathway protein C
MPPARRLLSVVIPATLFISAALHAQAISALVEATAIAAPALATGPLPISSADSEPRPSAERILRAFPTAKPPPIGEAPVDCTGVRATVIVQAEEQDASLVALDLGGTRMLRRKGMDAGDMTVAWVGADRTWLVKTDGSVCEARVFAPAMAVHPEPKKQGDKPPVAVQGIVRTSPSEVQIDRGTLDKLLENPGELAKVRVTPEATGIKIAKVPKDSILGVLGIEEGDRLLKAGGIELTSPEKIMELYARLRTYEKLSIVVERKGKPMTMDYVIR